MLGIQEPDTYRLTVIPTLRWRITNLPERRRRAFRDGLNRLISAASAHPAAHAPMPEPVVSPAPEIQAVLGRACALCQGFCCRAGGNHAYLTVETIRRYMAEHPDLRPRDVLAAYLGRVGPKTVEKSCVFHGPEGCRLSRDMRSDTCNEFYCGGLNELRSSQNDQEPVRAFFVAMAGATILTAAFCDQNESRVVPLTSVTDEEP